MKKKTILRIIAFVFAVNLVLVSVACDYANGKVAGTAATTETTETTEETTADTTKKSVSVSKTSAKSVKKTEKTTEESSETESTTKETETEKSGNSAGTSNNNSGTQSGSNTGNSTKSYDGEKISSGSSSSTGSGSNSGSSGSSKNNDSGSSSSSSGSGSSSGSSSSGSGSGSSSGSESTKKHTHSYSSKITKEATCGSDGIIKYTCSCGDSYTETIPATGEHNWTGHEVIQEATCCQEEIFRQTCSKCGATQDVNTGYYADHDWYEIFTVTTADVILSWKCNHCGQLFDTTEELLLHQSRDDCHGTYGTYTWSTPQVFYCTTTNYSEVQALVDSNYGYGTQYYFDSVTFKCRNCGCEQ